MKILYISNISNSKESGLNVATTQLLNSICKYAEIDWLNLSDSVFDMNKSIHIKNLKNYLDGPLPDIAVFESPFSSLQYSLIAKALRRKMIPYILSPHGSFHKVALQKSSIKKWIVMHTIFYKFFRECRAVKFLTIGEKNNSVCFNESIIIPNGIEDKGNYRVRDEIRTIVFIGRKLKYTKGIDILLEACYKLKSLMIKKQITVHIYGPKRKDEDEQFIDDFIEKNEMSAYVFNHNAIFDEEKDAVLQDADLYIQTSRHEGFPMTILEALSYGIPVLVTEGTNVGDIVEETKAGWVAKTDSNDVALKIKEAIKSFPICQYSENARNVSMNYTWDEIAKQSIKQNTRNSCPLSSILFFLDTLCGRQDLSSPTWD